MTTEGLPTVCLLTVAGLYCLARGLLAFPSNVLASLRPLGIVVAVVALFLIWTLSGLAPITNRGKHGSMTTRRTVTGKTELTARFAPTPGKPHTPVMTAKHEGGHAAAAVAAGGRVIEARAWRDGSGLCRANLPCGDKNTELVNYMSYMVGGEVAVNSLAGCGHDQKWAKWARDQLPEEDRAAGWRKAYAKARAAQSSHAHVAKAVASALIRTGRY